MDIMSDDKQSKVYICEGEFKDPQNYSITVSSHGFSGTNDGVFLLKRKDFLADLHEAVESGGKTAVLDGSENFKMQISRLGAKGELWLEIQIGKVVYFQDGAKSKDFIFTCGFIVSGEYAYSLVLEFEALLKPQSGRRL